MIVRTLLGLLLGAVTAPLAPAQTPAEVEALIRKLGSPVYVEREKARRELEAAGTNALEALKRAPRPADPEAQSRLTELIRRAEEKLLTQQVLAPKQVHLKLVNATLDEAISELAKQGYPLQFQGDRAPLANKKITLDTGKTTFWQAVDQLCEQFGLIERIDPQPVPPTTTGLRIIGKKGRILPAGRETATEAIVLTNRGNEKVLASYAGAVKSSLRITRDPAAKELVLHFTVSIEPRLLNGALAGRPMIETIVDENGRKLAEGATAPSAAPGAGPIRFAIDNLSSLPAASSRQVQVRIKAGEQAARQIQDLAGKLALQVDLANETIARVEKVLDAAGKSADGANGGTLKVTSVRKVEDNIEVQVSMTNLTPNPFANNIIINGGNVIIRGNINVQGGIVIGPNGVSVGGQSVNSRPDLVDARGQKFQVVSAHSNGTSINAGVVSTSATIVYRPHPGQAAPADLVLFGNRTHTIAVPFRFENVTLP